MIYRIHKEPDVIGELFLALGETNFIQINNVNDTITYDMMLKKTQRQSYSSGLVDIICKFGLKEMFAIKHNYINPHIGKNNFIDILDMVKLNDILL